MDLKGFQIDFEEKTCIQDNIVCFFPLLIGVSTVMYSIYDVS